MAIKTKEETQTVKGELVTNTSAEISQVQMNDIASTVLDVDAAVEQWESYQELCKRLLNDNDYQLYVQNGKQRKFPKKSAFFKLGRAFNVDIEILDKKEYRHPKNNRVIDVEYTVKATLPNGRSVVEVGSCDKYEKGKSNISAHDLRATAKTRATNRAIAELIGAGEVSWEEVNKK